MLARCTRRAVGIRPVRALGRRRYGSTAPLAAPCSTPPSSAAVLAPLMSELDRMAPSFDVSGDNVTILSTPAEFYATLKGRIQKAKRRIFLSTLYIGRSEQDLIAVLCEALRRTPDLTVSILTDALRGTREAPEASCASLLAPLVAEFGASRVEIRMYHTPNLTGLRRACVPRRINEGWGLQHMKLYGVDDEIILSGANLSTDYFTNRLDRYHLFASKQVTDHFYSLHKGVGSCSFLVEPSEQEAGFCLSWPSSNAAPSPLDDAERFIEGTTRTLQRLIAPRPGQPRDPKSDTRIYMLAQMSQVLRPDVSTELPVITRILEYLASPALGGSSWTFTAGYFNPAPALSKLLVGSAAGGANVVITAAPEANGFYKSRGISGLLPDAYVLLARRFLRSVEAAGRAPDIELKEWRRGTAGQPGGWTYHAKGLWVTLPGQAHPALSVVGSSNYTRRSYSLDLEAGALIVTHNEGLQRRLADEQRWLQEDARRVTMEDFARAERRVGIKVRLAMWMVQLLGGAL
ncbi:hypothetical protein CDD81_6840 [Ophiocordyceps australis]|uniref:CDP-diacylglycerol--glycerol-3-phosphate 3-phosphatidyltransferase n=1 Tax=Ophiocordyceps australis TaxID=1399860 RepID=A0A2C5Y4J3_9HYPO|nr:hypothetical protein CDD81_6840 [Ophiocordyceps australis]